MDPPPAHEAKFFTICVPVYNGAAFVEKAVDSILRQTFQDFEIVICEDASQDNTWELLQARYGAHPKIRLFRNERNLRQFGNLNRCMSKARGGWIGFLPADDFYRLEALETIHSFLLPQEDAAIWIHTHLVTGNSQLPDIPAPHLIQRIFSGEELATTLYRSGNIYGGLSSFLFRREAVSDLTFEDLPLNTDTVFWIKLALQNKDRSVVFWPEALSVVLNHPMSVSSKSGDAGLDKSEIFAVAGRLAGLGWPRKILAHQILRIAYCWLRFHSQLPQNQKSAPLRAIKDLVAAFGGLSRSTPKKQAYP